MRILFLVHTVDWLETGGGPYQGAGWTSALIRAVLGAGHEAGVAYQTSRRQGFRHTEEGIPYYAIPSEARRFGGKMAYYYGGYRKEDGRHLLPGLEEAIRDFRPALIHLFGFENPLSVALGHTDVPVVVHMQGLLGPVSEAFCPPGVTEKDFRRRFFFREVFLRNGYRYMARSLRVRAALERERMALATAVMGRTEWDREIARERAPQARYFHVDELLRDAFYRNAGTAVAKEGHVLRIYSTLSPTVYKGLDVVLCAARLLQEAGVAFEWTIAGIEPKDRLIAFFEWKTGLSASALGIRFVGCIGPEEIVAATQAADVYVHPSYIDNSPNSLCEAQMLGLPVVATRVGGVPSLVTEGKDGFLVPAGDAVALASRLQQLRDVSLRAELGRQGAAAAAARHEPETILRDLMNAYQCIL